MKLIGACQPRTGTMSFHTAMTGLNLRSYHMKELMLNTLTGRGDLEKWKKVTQLEPFHPDRLVLLKEIFDDYDACSDSPACYVFEELMQIYPGTHVVVTDREAAKWRKSVADTVWEGFLMTTGPGARQMVWIMKLIYHLPIVFVFGISGVLMDFLAHGGSRVFLRPYLDQNGKPLDFRAPENFPELERRFVEWNKNAIAAVPPEKCIVLRAPYDDAYARICPAVNLPVPKDQKWPHVNDQESIKQGMRTMRKMIYVIPAIFLASCAGIVYLIVTSRDPILLAAIAVVSIVVLYIAQKMLLRFFKRIGTEEKKVVSV